MINSKHKKAFSMITAIIVIVIMAAVTALIMNITGKTIKETTQLYQKEQAALLARSYTELAISRVINTDRTPGTPGTCMNGFTDTFGNSSGSAGYKINVQIRYIGNTNLLGKCTGDAINPWAAQATSFEKTISLVIDTYITYKDFDDPSNRDIAFHRRTVQKL